MTPMAFLLFVDDVALNTISLRLSESSWPFGTALPNKYIQCEPFGTAFLTISPNETGGLVLTTTTFTKIIQIRLLVSFSPIGYPYSYYNSSDFPGKSQFTSSSSRFTIPSYFIQSESDLLNSNPGNPGGVILEVKSSLSLMRFPDMAVANDVDVISSIFLLLCGFSLLMHRIPSSKWRCPVETFRPSSQTSFLYSLRCTWCRLSSSNTP
eukprot:scaffold34586_cov99-Skeletonema_dohrnii-CCMP3373.AAC.1